MPGDVEFMAGIYNGADVPITLTDPPATVVVTYAPMTFVAVTGGEGWSCVDLGDGLHCTFSGTIAEDSTEAVRVFTSVDESVTGVDLSVEVGYSLGMHDPNSGNDTVNERVAIGFPDPDADEESSSPAPMSLALASDTADVIAGGSVLIDVLANDTISDGTVDVAVSPMNGTTVVTDDQHIEYTAREEFSGLDSFVYEACDSSGECGWAAVSVQVLGMPAQAPVPADVPAGGDAELAAPGGGNDDPANEPEPPAQADLAPPVAVDDNATTAREVEVLVDVLRNDIAPSGELDPASVRIVADAASGSAFPNPDGTISYTPGVAFTGVDSFDYEVCDDNDLCARATVTIAVDEGEAVDDGNAPTEDTSDGVDDENAPVTENTNGSPDIPDTPEAPSAGGGAVGDQGVTPAPTGTPPAAAPTNAERSVLGDDLGLTSTGPATPGERSLALPNTGSSSALLAGLGAGLLVAGAVFVGLGRRQHAAM